MNAPSPWAARPAVQAPARREPAPARSRPMATAAVPVVEPRPGPEPEAASEVPSSGGWILPTLESVAMIAGVAAAALLLFGAVQDSRTSTRVLPGVTLAGQPIGGLDRDRLADVAARASEDSLDRELVLRAGSVDTRTTARALGAVPDPDEVIEQALALGHSGDLLGDLRARGRARRGEIDLRIGMRFDERLALEQLLALGPDVDTMSVPTRLDLERRKVLPATRGTALLPYDSLSNVAIGLASGLDTIELAVAHKPAIPPSEDPLGLIADQLDIGVVLGSFSTPYSMDIAVADRTHNLEVGAAALDGHVLMPGETFSFNAVVGERSVEAGYRYAPGIEAGQLVDVIGGGICQVASTIYGAGFFAGLEIVHARPHSRPSAYVDMGLDATVVWPNVDLVLRNQFDFPIVLHMTVSQGQVRAEVLGPRRPYQVAFERTLKEAKPFETVVRDDPHLRLGHDHVVQRGMRGFELERVRKLYQGGEVVATEVAELEYPPTREIIRRGSNPAGEVPERKSLPALRDPAGSMRIMQ
jgi:hypothetical protein